MHDYAHVHEDEDAYGNDYENEGQDVFDRIRVTAPVPEPELDGRAGAGGTFHQRRYTGYAPTMYRDRRNSCPTCRSILIHSGSVERCPDCAGCLVGEPVLREMVLGMTDGISEGDLEWEATEGGTPKMCPACRQAMTMVRMKDVTADRCGEHGFWFDPTELQTVLHATGETKGKPASQSFWQGLLSCLIESEEEEYRRFTETRRGHESFHEWRMRGRE